MQRCFDRYLAGRRPGKQRRLAVVEIGSAEVNGSYREIFAGGGYSYLGCDVAAGPGVDIVLDDPCRLPLPDASADVVISGRMLEHNPRFRLAFAEMLRVVRADGFVFLIAPSSGPVHACPVDCRRFYPHGFRALADFAGCRLVELWHDDRGPWNDLVGVFRHSAAPAPTPREIDNSLAAAQQAYRERLLASGMMEESFAAPPEAERMAGAVHYLDVLRRFHDRLSPKLYFEIGVRRGHSLAVARGRAVGVDPLPELAIPLPPAAQIFAETSDCFFDRSAAAALASGIDLAFIDGLHRAEFVLRDLMNVERHARPGALVAIDDVFPNHPLQAERTRRTRAWCGDVWKIASCLERYRPDLLLLPLDTAPTGLLLVAGLDPANRSLRDRYNPIARELAESAPTPPDEILARQGALSPDDPRLDTLLALLADLAVDGGDVVAARQLLLSWRQRHGL